MIIVHKENSNIVVDHGHLPLEEYQARFPDFAISEYPNESVVIVPNFTPEGDISHFTYTVNNMTKDQALNYMLDKLDVEVSKRKAELFNYDGNIFHPELENIHGTRTRLGSMPTEYTLSWKTADKDTDGVSNIYRTFTITEFEIFSDAFYDHCSVIWHVGDQHKINLKALYNQETSSSQDIMDYDISVDWP